MNVSDRMTRRALVNAIGSLAASASLSSAPALSQERTRIRKARDVAARRRILFGSAFDQHIFASDDYAKLLGDECAILTPDYSMKFGSLRASLDRADFSVVDKLFAFASACGAQMRGHTLIWNDFMPDWTKRLSSREMERLLDRHIDEVVGRYAGRVHSWDVVNEPIWIESGHEGGLRGGPWYDAMGRSYISRSFKRARRADPHGKLVLNEAFLEYKWRDSPFAKNRLTTRSSPWPRFRGYFLDLVKRLLDEGTPLDAIGMESHLSPKFRDEYDRASLLEFMHAIEAMGLDIYITELDVDDSTFPDDIPVRDRDVGDYYYKYLKDVLSVGAVRMIVTWELSDKHTSVAENIRSGRVTNVRMPRTLPFDVNMKPKPAYDAIVSALTGD